MSVEVLFFLFFIFTNNSPRRIVSNDTCTVSKFTNI